MQIDILTLFPEMFISPFNQSIIKRAQEKDLVVINTINIRQFAADKHHQVDDYPYGGGAGMVMQAGPIIDAYVQVKKEYPNVKRVIYLSPQGQTLNQDKVLELAREDEILFICGHYEGIDERVIESIVTEELSIGDYVLTGGEMAVMVVIDAVSRHVEGVLSNSVSAEVESFDNGLLEYPQYTRPADYEGQIVPDVLLSGNHQKIEQFRHEQSLIRTAKKRPDLLRYAVLSEEDKIFLKKTCHIDTNML